MAGINVIKYHNAKKTKYLLNSIIKIVMMNTKNHNTIRPP